MQGDVKMMEIKTFKGFEEIYPERFDETDSWYYGHWSPCAEAYEVPAYNNQYPGTRLYFFEYPSGRVFEPLKQQPNVFLSRPVYEQKDNSFGILRYDFNKEIIQVIVFKPESFGLEIVFEIPFSKVGDVNNIRLMTSPWTLMKYDINHDTVRFLWPREAVYHLEPHETMYFQAAGKLYLSNWMEDPDYREEIIVRDAQSGQILERCPGYMRRMPDGSVWMMTSE